MSGYIFQSSPDIIFVDSAPEELVPCVLEPPLDFLLEIFMVRFRCNIMKVCPIIYR